ncbi:MAG: TonB-dependent siderophore receptor [Sphingobium sp.]
MHSLLVSNRRFDDNSRSLGSVLLALAGCTFLSSPAYALGVETAAASDAEADAESGEIIVNAQRQTRQIADGGALGARSLLETPFSVGAVDAEDLKRNAATTIDAAFNYDASIRSNNSGVASGNTFSSRGIAIDRTNGYKLDGLPFPYWFQDHPIEHLEQIQILKGAGGFVYGFASPGGVVNFVSKRPTRDLEIVANVSYRSSSIARAHLDIGGPLNDDGSIGFRFNAVHEQGRLYNGAFNRNQFFSLALEGRLTDNLSWYLDGFYQRTLQKDQSNGISYGTAVTYLTPTTGKLNLGAEGGSKFNDVPIVTGRLKWEFSPDWNANISLRYADIDERFPGNTIQILNNAGDYTSTAYNMNRIFWYTVSQAALDGRFNTGSLEHQVTAGVSTTTVDFEYDNPTRQAIIGRGNIYNPSFVPAITGNPAALFLQRPPVWTRYQTIEQYAAFASDTITWGGLSALIGLRYTDYIERNFDPTSKVTSYFHYRPVSPVYSLSYELLPKVRLYGTYVEALQRGGLAPATATNANASFGPLKSTQYEVGVKLERAWGDANIALYRIKLPSEYVNGSNAFVRDGEARHQGFEANLNVRPTSNLSVALSVAYLDAKQISGNSAIVGKRIASTTEFQATGQVEYAVPYLAGLKLTGGARYSGKAYGQAANSFVYPSVTVGDVGASYSFSSGSQDYTVRAFVQNITDERYWVPSASGTGLSAGAPRTFSVSAEVALRNVNRDGRPFSERRVDGRGFYLGVAAGLLRSPNFVASSAERVYTPSNAPIRDALRVDNKTGWDVESILGYDLGLVRTEFEGSYKRLKIRSIAFNDNSVALDSAARPVGLYGNAGGGTEVLSGLFNALLDIGGTAKSPWAISVGGGLGIARVSSGRWTFDQSTGPYFSDDNSINFAWQSIAGIRRAVTDRVDLMVKYRFFNVPNLSLRTMNANEIEGNFKTHSILVGTTFNF